MRIVFMGTPDFAVASLDAIVKAGFDVAAVITATDKPAGRGKKIQYSAVKKYALDNGISTILQPEKLKNEFGSEVTFWGGGVETVGTLNKAKPEEVRSEVLNRLEIMSKGGGFIFNTVHNILPDVPPENIVAMFNAVKEFNK